MDLLIKLCKECDTEKIACDFKKYRHVCRRCDAKLNYAAYKDKFVEYYQKDKAYRSEYQKVYKQKKRESMPAKKRGRPFKVVEIIEEII